MEAMAERWETADEQVVWRKTGIGQSWMIIIEQLMAGRWRFWV